MNYELTIALPCYNLEKSLKMSLESILTQNRSNEVEILIVDNASTDNSVEIAKQYEQQYENVKCVENGCNIGPDRNFLKCLEIAQGNYILLLGDDLLLDGVLDNIFECIAQDPDFVFLNYSPLISTEPLKTGKTYVKAKNSDDYYIPENIDDLFLMIGHRMTFLSSLIFKKERFDKIPQDVRESYINSFFLQTHLALLTLKDSTKNIIIQKNCVAAGANLGCGYDFYNVWFEQYHKLLFETGGYIGVSESTIEKLWVQQKATIRAIFYFRWVTKSSKKWDKKCVFRNLKGHPWLKFKAFIAVYLPRFLLPFVMFLRAIYRKIKRSKAKTK